MHRLTTFRRLAALALLAAAALAAPARAQDAVYEKAPKRSCALGRPNPMICSVLAIVRSGTGRFMMR